MRTTLQQTVPGHKKNFKRNHSLSVFIQMPEAVFQQILVSPMGEQRRLLIASTNKNVNLDRAALQRGVKKPPGYCTALLSTVATGLHAFITINSFVENEK